MGKGSCLNCKDRYVGCHEECQKYKDFLADHEKKKAFISPSAGDLYVGEKRRQRKIGKK